MTVESIDPTSSEDETDWSSSSSSSASSAGTPPTPGKNLPNDILQQQARNEAHRQQLQNDAKKPQPKERFVFPSPAKMPAKVGNPQALPANRVEVKKTRGLQPIQLQAPPKSRKPVKPLEDTPETEKENMAPHVVIRKRLLSSQSGTPSSEVVALVKPARRVSVVHTQNGKRAKAVDTPNLSSSSSTTQDENDPDFQAPQISSTPQVPSRSSTRLSMPSIDMSPITETGRKKSETDSLEGRDDLDFDPLLTSSRIDGMSLRKLSSPKCIGVQTDLKSDDIVLDDKELLARLTELFRAINKFNYGFIGYFTMEGIGRIDVSLEKPIMRDANTSFDVFVTFASQSIQTDQLATDHVSQQTSIRELISSDQQTSIRELVSEHQQTSLIATAAMEQQTSLNEFVQVENSVAPRRSSLRQSVRFSPRSSRGSSGTSGAWSNREITFMSRCSNCPTPGSILCPDTPDQETIVKSIRKDGKNVLVVRSETDQIVCQGHRMSTADDETKYYMNCQICRNLNYKTFTTKGLLPLQRSAKK